MYSKPRARRVNGQMLDEELLIYHGPRESNDRTEVEQLSKLARGPGRRACEPRSRARPTAACAVRLYQPIFRPRAYLCRDVPPTRTSHGACGRHSAQWDTAPPTVLPRVAPSGLARGGGPRGAWSCLQQHKRCIQLVHVHVHLHGCASTGTSCVIVAQGESSAQLQRDRSKLHPHMPLAAPPS